MLIDCGSRIIDETYDKKHRRINRLLQRTPDKLNHYLRDTSKNKLYDKSKLYKVSITAPESNCISTIKMSLFDILVLYGKIDSILALPWSKSEISELVKRADYFSMSLAAANGRLDLMKLLESYLTEDEIIESVKVRNYIVIACAVHNGQTEVIEYLLSRLNIGEIKKALSSERTWTMFRVAARKGQIKTIKLLFSFLNDDEKKNVLIYSRYEVIVGIIERGDIDEVVYFLSFLDEAQKKEALKTLNYQFIWRVGKSTNLKVMEYLFSLLNTAEIKEALTVCDYLNIHRLFQTPQIDMIKYVLFFLDDAEKREALKRFWSFDSIYSYVYTGRIDLIKYLSTFHSDAENKERLKSYFYIQMAAEVGRKEVLDYLLSFFDDAEKKEAIKADGYAVIKHDNIDIRNYFLQFPVGFAYAELHDYEYGQKCIYLFVQHKLDAYKEAKRQYEQANPGGTFNLDNTDAELCFYILRNLIRRGVRRSYSNGRDIRLAEDLKDEIRFLLNIPSVRSLCHRQMSVEGGENELLRLATQIHNQDAYDILMELPDVWRVAWTNTPTEESLNLRRFANNPESSMIPVSKSEQNVFDKLRQVYQPLIDKLGGELKAFEQLKLELIRRYEEKPARIEISNIDDDLNKLPLEWEEFQKRKSDLLSRGQYEQALYAYHQHAVHTVYRYFLKPNYWMAANASYVYVYYDKQGKRTNYRYAMFEDSLSLIVLLYIAAFDENSPAVDGYTLEDRKILFIKQLALIARAHNWDNSRLKIINGITQFDRAGKPIWEEFDDYWKGDKPSCHQGTMSRAMTAVLGHRLIAIISDDIMIQAINNQVRVYFDSVITKDNCQKLKSAYDAIVNLDGDFNRNLETLKLIDLTADRKEAIMIQVCNQLEETYQDNFTERKKPLKNKMVKYLNGNKHAGCDFIYFDGALDLSRLLDGKLRVVDELRGSLGFFDKQARSSDTHNQSKPNNTGAPQSK